MRLVAIKFFLIAVTFSFISLIHIAGSANAQAKSDNNMINSYHGNVVLDKNGEATVSLPGHADSSKNDFLYQAMPIGAPAPNLYIAEEINSGKFRIAGGKKGMRVSWQVTGVQDGISGSGSAAHSQVSSSKSHHKMYPRINNGRLIYGSDEL